jgi:hypothetical protein
MLVESIQKRLTQHFSSFLSFAGMLRLTLLSLTDPGGRGPRLAGSDHIRFGTTGREVCPGAGKNDITAPGDPVLRP